VGTLLVGDALARAEAAGEPAVLVEGMPGYYPRFGFEPAGALGLGCPYPVAPEHWMAYRLPAYDPAIRGAFAYAPAFDRAA